MFASEGSGRTAFDASAATLPGVSWPSSVVRSIIRIASSSAKTFASRLIDRFARLPARSSSATASTDPILGSRGSSGSSNPRGSAGACAIEVSLAPGLLRKIAVTAKTDCFDPNGAVWMVDDVGAHLHVPDVLRERIESEGANAFTTEMLCAAAQDLEALARLFGYTCASREPLTPPTSPQATRAKRTGG